MSCSNTHKHENHTHSSTCGHTAVRHEGHIDYLVDGKLHHPHGDHCDEHTIQFSDINPNECKPVHSCNGHIHGPDCGHEAWRSHRLYR